MIEELQLINYWINSKDPSFLEKNELDKSYFISTGDIVEFIIHYILQYKDFPTYELLLSEFGDKFKKFEDLDNLDYLIDKVREKKVYVDYKQAIFQCIELLKEERVYEALNLMQNAVSNLSKTFSSNYSKYDWVQDVDLRFEKYLEKHNKGTQLTGLPTGHPELDNVTGGWLEDDLIILAGRTNEGKSLVSTYFAYTVWEYLHKNNITDRPIVYISTEMSEFEISYRLDTLKAHFSNKALNLGKLSNPEVYKEYLENLKTLKPSFIILTEEHNKGKKFSPLDIRRIIEVERPAFLVIDQLYDLRDVAGEREIRKRIINIVEMLRQINLSTKTPILLVVQANRQAALKSEKSKEETPEIENIQESDNPAQKATKVLTLRKLDAHTIKLSLKKNRSGEKDIDVYFKINIDIGIWEALTDLETKF